MADRALLLSRLDHAGRRGFEIGALMSPFLPDAGESVILVDRLSTPDLREKFAAEPGIDAARIAEVGVVVPEGQTLVAALAARGPFGFAIASHVIEHVADFAGFLAEIAELVPEPPGQLLLVVPDRRYTFDLLRQESTLREVIEACVSGRLSPSPGQIFDYNALAAEVDVRQAWAGGLDPATLKRYGSPRSALALSRRIHAEQSYLDSHCWVFTPRSLLRLCIGLAELGLLGWKLGFFADTQPGELDFGLVLDRASPGEDAADIARSFGSALGRLGPDEDETERAALRAEVARLRSEVAALRGSRSWRLTAPLRGLGAGLRRQRRAT